jgi:hypothetical protein
MGFDDKDKKKFDPKTVAKGATLAAMVAALGISLGTEVKSVYAQGHDLNDTSKLKLEGALALKIDTGGSQEIKVEDTHEIKLTNPTSGKILSMSGNRITILDRNNKEWSWGMSSSNFEYLTTHNHVGDTISFQVVNGQLVPQGMLMR